MASYLRSWLCAQDAAVKASTPPFVSDEAADVPDEDDDVETVHGDDDAPPAFPAVNSAQRAALDTANEGIPRVLTDDQLMPPPPPLISTRRPGVSANSSSSSSLLIPLTTTKPPPQLAKKGKVALAPGHGPLDWANLKKSGQDLRGTDTLLRVTPSMLKAHSTREDAWSSINGNVYNITPYLPYHPGGEKELMRVAGRDGSKLFALTHAWVNIDYMLDECLVGFMVSECAS